MKLCLLFMVFAGVVLIMANQLVACSQRPRAVEYRYLPRDLDTYLRTQPLASAQLQDMFQETSVLPRALDKKTKKKKKPA